MFFSIFLEPEQQQLVKQRLWDEAPTLREEDEILREEDEVEIDDGFYDITLKNTDAADEGEVLSLPADTEGKNIFLKSGQIFSRVFHISRNMSCFVTYLIYKHSYR